MKYEEGEEGDSEMEEKNRFHVFPGGVLHALHITGTSVYEIHASTGKVVRWWLRLKLLVASAGLVISALLIIDHQRN